VRIWLTGCEPATRINESAAGGVALDSLGGVTRFQHRRKINSALIRNTVTPIAIRTNAGSCLAMRASNSKNPELL
jgi:hypothetical protein